ncbi:MAG TPA: apolipoprotein N-acyltransferase [Acidimicrobiia bacterium]|nr:apolipoprotein N-acyltransferase [Acidimicrobiia bacterium]
MRQIAAVLFSAFLMWASFPPANLGLLIFVAPIPFLWAMRRVNTAREAGWLGFLFGAVFFGAMLSWMFILGAVAWIPVSIVMGLWAAGYALVMYVARTWSPWRWWSVAVGGWALWEFLRARLPLGGFPWGSVGYPVGTLSWPRAAAQWFGASGWGVLVIACAAGVVLTFDEEHDRRPMELALSVIVVFTLLGAVFAPDANGPAVRVAIVQGNSPCPRVHCDNEKVRIYNNHMSLTGTRVDAGSADLVVWGEDSFGGTVNPTFNGQVRRDMGAQAARIGGYLLAGGTRPGQPGTFDNYNVVFAPNGEVIGEYLKRHPVPFGEFVPFRKVLQFIPQLDEVPNDMNRGDQPVVFPIEVADGSGYFGSVISFEAAFSGLIRSEVTAGAQLIVVATNEGSYGRGSASDQLLGMVRMSAASLGVDVIHAAVTGKSTIIRADGSMGATSELFTDDVVRGVVNLQTSRRTVYAVAGDWLQALAILVSLVVLIGTVGGPSRDFKIRPQRRR